MTAIQELPAAGSDLDGAARAQLACGVLPDLPGRVAVSARAPHPAGERDAPDHGPGGALADDPADECGGELRGDQLVELGVVGGRGGDEHRPARNLALLHEPLDGVLTEGAQEDRVADAGVGEVVAAQVRDPGHHPHLQQREPGDVERDRRRHRHETAEVRQEPLPRREAGVVLDHLADRAVDVAVLLLELLLGHRRGRRERTDAVDRLLHGLVHEAAVQVGRHPVHVGDDPFDNGRSDAHALPFLWLLTVCPFRQGRRLARVRGAAAGSAGRP